MEIVSNVSPNCEASVSAEANTEFLPDIIDETVLMEVANQQAMMLLVKVRQITAISIR